MDERILNIDTYSRIIRDTIKLIEALGYDPDEVYISGWIAKRAEWSKEIDDFYFYPMPGDIK